jgi:UDP-N-acetylglucosamine 2-epimerase (non-hydrolysing)
MTRPYVALVVGTRPEVIKLAPVVTALRSAGHFEPLLISTGQHRQMLDQALGVFGLKPELDLEIMRPGQTLHDVTARTLSGMRDVLRRYKPAWVVVQGDTTTAFAAALAAFYDRLPVAHVEAGLRSRQRYSPFPEEVNRRMVDQLSTLLFAPTANARQLLLSEGFAPESIEMTGNTVVDALLEARRIVRDRPVAIAGLPERSLEGRRMILVTAHRRESFGPGIEAMCNSFLRILRTVPDVCIVYPVHMNPNVDGPVRSILGGEKRMVLVPPVSYLEFVSLIERAYLVLTDSGGVQEEVPTFGKPVLVMREVTERPEGIAAGVARLVGTNEGRIVDETLRLLADPAQYASMATGNNPYGDGCAAKRISEILVRAFSRSASGPARA